MSSSLHFTLTCRREQAQERALAAEESVRARGGVEEKVDYKIFDTIGWRTLRTRQNGLTNISNPDPNLDPITHHYLTNETSVFGSPSTW